MFSMFLQLFTCWYSLVRYLISFLSSVLPNLSLCVCLFVYQLLLPLFSQCSPGFPRCFVLANLDFSTKNGICFPCLLLFPILFHVFLIVLAHAWVSFQKKEQPDILNSPFQPQFLFVSMQFVCVFLSWYQLWFSLQKLPKAATDELRRSREWSNCNILYACFFFSRQPMSCCM